MQSVLRNRAFWICCGLIIATVAAYWPVATADFIVFDDQDYVYENPHVREGLSWNSVAWAWNTGQQSNWHPLAWWSLMLDVQFFGVSSRAMHLVNLALHVGNTLVLFLLLRQMTGAVWRSGMVAALFALHPLHVESVAWVAERKDVLSTLLGLLALWAYVGYAEKGLGERRLVGCGQAPRKPTKSYGVSMVGLRRTRPNPTVCYWLAFVLLALGLMAKPMLVTLPCVFLLLDYWPLGRGRGAERGREDAGTRRHGELETPTRPTRSFVWLIVEKLPFFALAAASSWITYRVQEMGGAMHPMERLTFLDRASIAGMGYVEYIDKMLWPANLSIFYPLPDQPNLALGFAAWAVLAGISVAVAVAAQRKVASAGYLLVGWLWYLGTLVPVIGLVQVGEQAMADRYTYLPLVGLFLALTWGATDLTAGWRRQHLCLAGLATGTLLGCTLLTAAEVRAWANTDTLFGQALRVQPDNWHARRLLAYWWWRQGRYEEAMEGWRQSLALHADDPDVNFDMGVAASEHGDKAEAIDSFRKVVSLRPERVDARGRLAALLTERGNIGAALEEWRALLERMPEDFVANNAVAWILATSPDDRCRNGRAAIEFAQAAVRLAHDRKAPALDTLSAAYAEAGQFEKAIQTAEESLELARQQGNKKLQESIATHLQSYHAGKPWRDDRLRSRE